MEKIGAVVPPEGPDDLPSRIEKMQRALTVPELAELLWLGRTAMYDKVKRGVIPYIKVGTSIRFDPVAIAKWLRDRTVLGVDQRRAA